MFSAARPLPPSVLEDNLGQRHPVNRTEPTQRIADRDYGVTVNQWAGKPCFDFSSKVGFPPTRAFIGVELDGRSGAT